MRRSLWKFHYLNLGSAPATSLVWNTTASILTCQLSVYGTAVWSHSPWLAKVHDLKIAVVWKGGIFHCSAVAQVGRRRRKQSPSLANAF